MDKTNTLTKNTSYGKKRRFKKVLVSLFLLFVLLLQGCADEKPQFQAGEAGQGQAAEVVHNSGELAVHYIDVGQGDATLITCGGSSMLIDAGNNNMGTTVQYYLSKQRITKLNYVVGTHPDADHIGGAPVIIGKFEIDKVFVSNYEKDNKTYQKLIQALDDKRLKYTTPKVGAQYTLGTATITILAPGKEYDDPNDASVALLVQNGNHKFLFTGDAGEEAEQDILDSGMTVSADVYHVGHHGSKTSTSEDFLEAVNPTYAVISCAEGNEYGHPHAQTLNALRADGVKVYRTDEAGTIIASSDGKKLTFNVPASETWKAGEPTGSSAAKSPASKEQSVAAGAASKEQSSMQESSPAVQEAEQAPAASDTSELTYVLNTKTKKFHKPSCSYLPTANRKDTSQSRESVIAQGYEPCKKCNP